jgi:hypothetical protein
MDYTKIPSEEKVNAMLGDEIKQSINTMLLCKVVKFDSATQRVDLRPCIKIRYTDNKSLKKMYTRMGKLINYSEMELPVLLNVPVSYPRSGNFMITLPVTVGDVGMLIISQQDLSIWKKQGGSDVSTDNIDLFNINDGVFLPYVPSLASAVSDYSSTALEIRDGVSKIKMDASGTIAITGNVSISGTLTATTDVVGGGKSLKNHTHSGTPLLVDLTPTRVTGFTGSPS